MKKLLYILSILTLSACSDKFLELYPETSLNEGNFYNSEDEFILLANGCYVPMRNYEKEPHWIIAEIPSDNASYQHNPNDGGAAGRRIIDQFLTPSSNSIYADFWNFSYNGVTRCNKLLYELDKHDVTWKTGIKERCYGEALFLRALYYFNLVRQFGGVPLVLEPITSQEAVNIKRSTEAVIYESIVNDLVQARSYFSQASSTEENGRANWGAATSLLGKVYLTLHQFDKAQTMLKEVIDSGKYGLLSNYADLFNPSKKDFKETIFAIQYSENSVELSNKFIFWFAPWSSVGDVTKRASVNINNTWSGWNQPTEDLINAFETGDKRKEVSIGFWTGKDWDGVVRPIPYCAKYKPPVSAPDARCSDNLPVLRYSDVILMYAEALNEQGKTVDAIPFVAQVRTRAGLVNPLDGSSKTALEDLIAKERQREFCFENQRWYDLKRTGKAIAVMTAHGIREKAAKPFLDSEAFIMNENKLLSPIPAEQILINGIQQNPGY